MPKKTDLTAFSLPILILNISERSTTQIPIVDQIQCERNGGDSLQKAKYAVKARYTVRKRQVVRLVKEGKEKYDDWKLARRIRKEGMSDEILGLTRKAAGDPSIFKEQLWVRIMQFLTKEYDGGDYPSNKDLGNLRLASKRFDQIFLNYFTVFMRPWLRSCYPYAVLLFEVRTESFVTRSRIECIEQSPQYRQKELVRTLLRKLQMRPYIIPYYTPQQQKDIYKFWVKICDLAALANIPRTSFYLKSFEVSSQYPAILDALCKYLNTDPDSFIRTLDQNVKKMDRALNALHKKRCMELTPRCKAAARHIMTHYLLPHPIQIPICDPITGEFQEWKYEFWSKDWLVNVGRERGGEYLYGHWIEAMHKFLFGSRGSREVMFYQGLNPPEQWCWRVHKDIRLWRFWWRYRYTEPGRR